MLKRFGEFKRGDMVKCISDSLIDHDCKNQIGTIIEIDQSSYPYCVKFFKPVLHGYDGWGVNEYCDWFKEEEIELYREPILKIFLKEKNNEK